VAAPLLRPETPADVQAIHRLTAEAFRSAPHTSGTEAFIVDALRHAGALTLSLVAEEAGLLVGHVGLSPVEVSDGSSGWYGLGPVSVLPSHQGRGIGSALVRDALARLRAMGASGCVLLGEPAYYGRFGFEADPALVLAGVPPAYFQVLAFNGVVARGEVKFHPGFEATAD
jgi:putative acetyltransferase